MEKDQAQVNDLKQIKHRIDEIAERIVNSGPRVVYVAGASCSGKSTITRLLAASLRQLGHTPRVITLDNYFLNPDQRPLDENGNIDFESFYGLDLKLLDDNINALLNGEKAEIPLYSFNKCHREEHGTTMQIAPNDILMLEGIHALNPELTPNIPKEQKFRIFVTARNFHDPDDPTILQPYDHRLLRRIVRDNIERGSDALMTLQWWPGVRRGEQQWILPFRKYADEIINTALPFEMPMIRDFAIDLLHQVTEDHPKEYAEAQRLIGFLQPQESMSIDRVDDETPLKQLFTKRGIKPSK